MKDEGILKFYTAEGSDDINNYLENKAAHSSKYNALPEQIKNACELVCAELKETLIFLKDNSNKLQEVPELYRITVLSHQQIDAIKSNGCYHTHRFLSTSRGICKIMSDFQLLKFKSERKGEREVLFRIKDPHHMAVDISKFSDTPEENEHLIPPGAKLQLIPGSVKRNGGVLEMSFNLEADPT